MRMRIVARREESLLLEPIQEPVPGWCIRPGTVRVAQPYDDSGARSVATQDINPLLSVAAPDSIQHSSEHVDSRPRKKQKRSKSTNNDTHDHDQELVQWVKAELQSIIEQDSFQSWIRDMQGDYFYGTLVGAPASNTFALDLVKLRPTLEMLRSGFFSASSGKSSASQEQDFTFDQHELESGSQQLDLGDIYEVIVTNNHREPALIIFPTEHRPQYLIPPRSGFLVSDLERIRGLTSVARQRGGFDIIVMDPPWQNASVDRMGHYGTMNMYDLFKIPIPELLGEKNEHNRSGIVAVWITNRAKAKKVVLKKLFPAWGLELAAHWIWLKVTTHGEPVLSLDNTHRKPYEGILIGRRRPDFKGTGANATLPSEICNINRKLLVSVPAQHSRKPSISVLLEEEFFSQNSAVPGATTIDNSIQGKMSLNKLELFARNLEEGVFSWGNEPIRHQYCGRGRDRDQMIQDGYLIPCPPSPNHS
ncbi:Methyltransferase-like protein 4 [Mortierella sp. NVP85]|nr:Methyltransferase-like protein 4 [Mortierella sp. NVP85]